MPVRRLGHAQHLTCERAYSGYKIELVVESYDEQRKSPMEQGKVALEDKLQTLNALDTTMQGHDMYRRI